MGYGQYVHWDVHLFGILLSVEWQFCAEVLVQPIGPIFKDQTAQASSSPFKDETDMP